LEEADKRLKRRGSISGEAGDVFEIIAGANFNQQALNTSRSKGTPSREGEDSD
jgi:hypothetical protein